MVSGRRKKAPIQAQPARADWSQKMTRQERYVTMIPPIRGPRAGPMRVPERNQPVAVPRSTGRYISLWCIRIVSRHTSREQEQYTYEMTAEPTRINDVPSMAVRMRKMKKAAKLGARAVPILHATNVDDVMRVIYSK